MKKWNLPSFLLTISLLNILTLSLSQLECWGWHIDQFVRYSINEPFTSANTTTSQADINGDGFPEKILWMRNHSQIALYSINNQTNHTQTLVWQSPAEWQVTQAAYSDLDNDGKIELTLLVWRDYKPWPIDKYIPFGGRIKGFHNSQGKSCQIILLYWHNGRMRERWAGSAMVNPVLSFASVDFDGDQKEDLLTLEGKYNYPSYSWSLSLWKWEGFGFTHFKRLNVPFQTFHIIKNHQNKPFILAQR